MEISALYKIYLQHPSIVTDSRKAQKNSIFFALKGEHFNGNAYAAIALENGCPYAIIDEKEYALDKRYIVVEDVLKSLQNLASYHREQLGIPILAVTGTNGKTTTKELINFVLGKKYSVVSTLGNLNNHIGVPLTLLSMNNSTSFGIVEMGANHPKEIEQLCNIALPNYGLITNIGKAHLEGFGSFEGVIRTKGELYNYLSENKGIIFYNSDNPILSELIEKTDVTTIEYGTKDTISCKGEFISSSPFLNLKISINDESKNIQTRLAGAYNFENVMAAACIGTYFGVTLNDIAAAIEDYQPDNNRSQLIYSKNNTLLLDYYNANPTSMAAAIENFSQLQVSNKILILGDMLELGKYALDEHLKIIFLLTKLGFENVFLTGPVFNSLPKPEYFKSFENIDDLAGWLFSNSIKSGYILVKGSRGLHLEKIIEYL
jgi:UDP-N-acetylmuramoyl-tripeptide--D-alanyl-D-alanine ligase